MITPTKTSRGLLEQYGEGTQLSIVYIVESTKTDLESNLDFSNIESIPCETLKQAIYISQEWQKANWNNISITMQVRKGNVVLAEDKAYEIEYIPYSTIALKDENEHLCGELSKYKNFIHEYKSEKLFESYQSNL